MKLKLAIIALLFPLVMISCTENVPAAPTVEKQEVVKEETKEEPKPKADPKEEKFVPYKEKVCIVVNGKEKCRVITKHKKHEGTKIKK